MSRPCALKGKVIQPTSTGKAACPEADSDFITCSMSYCMCRSLHGVCDVDIDLVITYDLYRW